MDGLYPFKLNSDENSEKTYECSLSSKNDLTKSYRQWHNRIGHIYGDRYQTLSNIRDDIPRFSRSITDRIDGVPCLTEKRNRAPIQRVTENRRNSHEKVHLDLSGPMTPTIGGNV